MNWNELYSEYKKPENEDIKNFIGENAALWDELGEHIKKTYKVKPQYSYSCCSAQPGWNVKYKKSGKSLCTLYPMDGFFIALVVIGKKEEDKVNYVIENDILTPYVKELIEKTPFSAGGRWLMIEIRDKKTLNDLKHLIAIRVKP